ncbi:hypothetical protein ENBRE01_0730 [Enteropsectra breve]|nr:hypothetical protein ENBRE01_0730 [Enteropsectra breve]
MEHNNLRFYMLLEVENIKQNHRNIPYSFVYPNKSLDFSCITVLDFRKLVFRAHKKKISDSWMVECSNFRLGRAFNSNHTSLYDTILQFNEHIEKEETIEVVDELGMWSADASTVVPFACIEKYKSS